MRAQDTKPLMELPPAPPDSLMGQMKEALEDLEKQMTGNDGNDVDLLKAAV